MSLSYETINKTSSALVSARAGQDSSTINQYVSSAASGIATISCTSIDCAFFNRYQCNKVAEICGECLNGYIGLFGSSNTQCSLSSVASTKSASDRACDSNSDCFSGYCDQRKCSIPSKFCPSSCSSRGSCIYRINGVEQQSGSTCLESDLSCTALCSCDAGYYGQDCSLTSANYLIRKSFVATLCSGLYQSLAFQDLTTANSFKSLATTVASMLTDSSLVDESALEECAMVLVEPLLSSSSVVCEDDEAYTAVVSALSSVLENNDQLSNDLVNSITSALTALSAACQANLAVGQEPFSVVTSNLRLTTFLSDASTFTKNSSFQTAQTAFEIANNDSSGTVTLDSDLLSLSTVASFGVSAVQYLHNPFGLPSNSSTMLLNYQG